MKFTQKGAAMLLFVLFFAFTSSVMMFALNQSIFVDLSDFSRLAGSKQAYLASESIVEDVVYRRVFDSFSVDDAESLTLGAVTAYATTTYDSPSDVYEVNGQAVAHDAVRKTQALLTISGGSSFSYGLQAGTGGITLANSSRIVGNVYSNGSVIGAGSAEVLGDIVSAGASGLAKIFMLQVLFMRIPLIISMLMEMPTTMSRLVLMLKTLSEAHVTHL